jgi:pyruvate-formate lyase
MNTRVQRLKDRLRVNQYPICTEKAQLIVESLRQTEGEPQIVRRAKATAHYVDNRQTLITAQQHPEQHRDLLVRVAGYSAHFVHLTKPVQDEIILRTEVESPGKEL